MTQEEKLLLLKDLCARLPYELKIQVYYEDIAGSGYFDETVWVIDNDEPFHINDRWIENIKPYLRSLSNMTEDEAMKIVELCVCNPKDVLSLSVEQDYISIEIDDGVAWSETYTLWFSEIVSSIKVLDFLNAHQFDYRGLIPIGLALEAPEDMYKN